MNRPISPARSGGIFSRLEVDERIRARRLAVVLPAHERPDQDAAAGDDEEGQREAEGLDGRVLGLEPAPGARLQDAQHHERRARRPRGPRRRRRAAASGPLARRRRPSRVIARMNTTRTTSPTNTTRQLSSVVAQPPRIGPDGDAGAGDATDHGVGDLSVVALEVAGDERGQRRQHQRRADALEDRPAQGEHRDRRRRRRSSPSRRRR